MHTETRAGSDAPVRADVLCGGSRAACARDGRRATSQSHGTNSITRTGHHDDISIFAKVRPHSFFFFLLHAQEIEVVEREN